MNLMFFWAARRLTHLRYGKTIKTTRLKRALLAWAFAGIFPFSGHAADSVLDATLEGQKLYFKWPLRWDEEDWLYFGSA